jgi:hypothetical protein
LNYTGRERGARLIKHGTEVVGKAVKNKLLYLANREWPEDNSLLHKQHARAPP